MMYLLISNIVLGICFAISIWVNAKERKRLTEMIAAKDYAHYKNFEDTDEETGREYKTMFTKRTRIEKNRSRIKEQE